MESRRRWRHSAPAWLLLGGSGSTMTEVLLMILVLASGPVVYLAATRKDKSHIATLLGIAVAPGASWNGLNATFGPVSWLLPVAPLAIDAACSALRCWRHRVGSSVQVSVLIARAAGHTRAAGIVLFVLGLAWYGIAAWWSQTAKYSVLIPGAVVSASIVCVWLVVSAATRPAPSQAATTGAVATGSGWVNPSGCTLGFDELCAIAVGLVVFCPSGPIESSLWERSSAIRIFNVQIGVHIFLVLSVLLTTYLLLSEYARIGQVEIPRLYLRRVMQILPVHYAAIATSFTFSAAGGYVIHPKVYRAAIATS